MGLKNLGRELFDGKLKVSLENSQEGSTIGSKPRNLIKSANFKVLNI